MTCFATCPPCPGCEELRARLIDVERERDQLLRPTMAWLLRALQAAQDDALKREAAQNGAGK